MTLRFSTPARAPAVMAAQAMAAGPGALEFDLFGDVGAGEFTVESVAAKLSAPHSGVRIRINSDGGSVNHGFGIYNLLAAEPGPVRIDVVGAAMSAAAHVLLAATESTIATNGVVMFHESAVAAVADASAGLLTSLATELSRINDATVKAIVDKSTLDTEAARAMLSVEGTYLSAEQAVKLGIVTRLAESAATARALSIINHVPAPGARAPAAFLAAVAAAKHTEQSMTIDEIMAALAGLSPEDLAALQAHLATLVEAPEADAAADAAAAASAAEQSAADAEAHAAVASIRQLLQMPASAPAPSGAAASDVAAQLVQIQASVADLTAERNKQAVDLMLHANANRCPPALANTIRSQVAAGAMTLASATAIASANPEVPTASNLRAGIRVPQVTLAAGLNWAQMKPTARAQLKKEDPEQYALLRAGAIERGEVRA